MAVEVTAASAAGAAGIAEIAETSMFAGLGLEIAEIGLAELGLFDAVSGVCGAVCCTYAGLPFDVAKVRLQSQNLNANPPVATASAPPVRIAAPRYTGILDCVMSTIREDGFRGLFRGAAPALASACAENAVGISVQHWAHRKLAMHYGDPEMRFSMMTECGLGGFAGIFTSVAMCPFEVTKVQLQVARMNAASGANAQSADLGACVKSILRNQGVRGFYRGLTGLWARDIPFNAVFYGGYETLCTAMMHHSGLHSKDELRPHQVLCAGGCAGALGWSLVLPFDVVKTRLQSGQIEGTFCHALRTIARKEGMKGLFSGWGPAVMRAFPANAGLFLGVEMSSRWMHQTLS